MSGKPQLRFWLLIPVFLILVGCGSPGSQDAASGELMFTAAAETVSAVMTITAASQPTQEPAATAAATVTATATPITTPTVTATLPSAAPAAIIASATSAPVVVSIGCDVAGFVSDVTIPDNTAILGGNDFTKTWELSNDGTCTWDSDYLLVFYSGSQMDGPSTQQLTSDSVAPGETIDISVELTAPSSTGTYTGYWILRNASGTNFGIGASGGSFYVQIVVSSVETYTPTITSTSGATSTPTSTTAVTSTSTATTQATSTTAPAATATATVAPTAVPTTVVPTAAPTTTAPTNTSAPPHRDACAHR